MSSTFPNARHLALDMRDGLARRIAEYRSLKSVVPTPVREYVRGAVFYAYFTSKG